jgi:hypothetical protein
LDQSIYLTNEQHVLDDVKAFTNQSILKFLKFFLLSHNHFNRPIEIVFSDLHPKHVEWCVGGDALKQFNLNIRVFLKVSKTQHQNPEFGPKPGEI